MVTQKLQIKKNLLKEQGAVCPVSYLAEGNMPWHWLEEKHGKG